MKEFFLLSNQKKINILEDDNITQFNNIIINIHGFGSHFQYRNNCENDISVRSNYFKQGLIKTFGIELSGHGKSDGCHGYIDDHNDLVKDIKNLIDYIQYKYPNIPIYVMGESLGGGLCIKLGILFKDLIKGIILLAPLIDINSKNKPSYLIEKAMIKLSHIIPKYKLIKTSKNSKSILNPKYEIERKKNKYSYNDHIMLSTGRELILLVYWIKENINKFDIPIIIFHAQNDDITDFNSSKHFFDKIKSKDKELVDVEFGHHAMLVPICEYDIYPSIILNKIVNWIIQK
uniref:Serine aminopeptidase S33 n=1 Tax=Megaviridae environmental sample TaxID=1737588 RepID=A0A5J6VMK0_9VIRU|nr:MAG: serine aminopeptidase S33 [Megaviridae environmental sample]